MPESGCPVCGRPFYNVPEGPYSAKAAEIFERTGRVQAEPLPHPTGDHLCGDCLAGPPAYNSAKSALVYAGAAARSIVRLKYHGEKAQIKTLSALVERRLTAPLLPDGSQPDLIVPMPISAKRRAERGFNQAFELAWSLYRPWRKLIDDTALTRPADGNIHQAALSADDRRKAVRGCFKVQKPSEIKGAKVLLFDDVLTTGATAGEATRILLAAGAARVDVVTVARTILKAWR